ncbi:ROK family protein [Gryllotalpicola protaetiae]|uniref:ROK family protein n=1 Tax=Gryllotalpicola protaetiae TaxID=2419771 RepID=A0A387BT45_9MICO|nr:ROK family protein [Gryllotalpicola protaetiae]AYG04117.1 ROK family protein [Gryllotalpicola protaetiae]
MATTRRGNNLDSVRMHNLSTVLTIAHHVGPVSRSDVTRETGLNRSTIGALVGELVDLGLVTESGPNANLRVGRPSPVISPNPRVAALAVNPEIDAVTVGLVGLDGRVQQRRRVALERVPTPDEAVAAATDAIAGLIETASVDHIVGIGVAMPGLVRPADGLVRRAPHLGWVDVPFAQMLTDACGLPVRASNDAQLGAYAEHVFGAGVGVSELIYVNGGSSGIGGGVILGGAAFTGAAGHAGELGHVRVGASDAVDSGGLVGTLEAEVSRARLLEALGLEGKSVDADGLTAAVLASEDPAVRAEVHRQLELLATALGTALTLFNPRLVVLGGFLATIYQADAAALDRAVAHATLPETLEGVQITRTRLGSDILLIGAAELAFEPLLADPASLTSA